MQAVFYTNKQIVKNIIFYTYFNFFKLYPPCVIKVVEDNLNCTIAFKCSNKKYVLHKQGQLKILLIYLYWCVLNFFVSLLHVEFYLRKWNLQLHSPFGNELQRKVNFIIKRGTFSNVLYSKSAFKVK